MASLPRGDRFSLRVDDLCACERQAVSMADEYCLQLIHRAIVSPVLKAHAFENYLQARERVIRPLRHAATSRSCRCVNEREVSSDASLRQDLVLAAHRAASSFCYVEASLAPSRSAFSSIAYALSQEDTWTVASWMLPAEDRLLWLAAISMEDILTSFAENVLLRRADRSFYTCVGRAQKLHSQLRAWLAVAAPPIPSVLSRVLGLPDRTLSLTGHLDAWCAEPPSGVAEALGALSSLRTRYEEYACHELSTL